MLETLGDFTFGTAAARGSLMPRTNSTGTGHFGSDESRVCDRVTLRECIATRIFTRWLAVVCAGCIFIFTRNSHASEVRSKDVQIGIGLGASDSGSTVGANLQLNLREAGWALRTGGSGGPSSLVYLGAGKLWCGSMASDWLSYTLYGGLEVASSTHVEATRCVSGLTTADNWPIGGDSSCDYES